MMFGSCEERAGAGLRYARFGSRFLIVALCAFSFASPAGSEEFEGSTLTLDVELGSRIFAKECGRCHMVGEGAHARVGPQLNNIFDRGAGHADGFRYSEAMVRAGNDGLVWTAATLDAFLLNPRAVVSRSRMAYRGLRADDERAAVIAYLGEYSVALRDVPEGPARVAVDVPELDRDLPEALLAAVGDAAYGEYLASECVSCHQVDGGSDGVPSITGWPHQDFIAAMHAYRSEVRPHPVMQMVARRLDDEQIASLSMYFGGLQAD